MRAGIHKLLKRAKITGTKINRAKIRGARNFIGLRYLAYIRQNEKTVFSLYIIHSHFMEMVQLDLYSPFPFSLTT